MDIKVDTNSFYFNQSCLISIYYGFISIPRPGTNHQILRPASSSFFMSKAFSKLPFKGFSLSTDIN